MSTATARTLREAAQAIERRRLARRRRWFQSHRWTAEKEAAWSQGMWDASLILHRLANEADSQSEETP